MIKKIKQNLRERAAISDLETRSITTAQSIAMALPNSAMDVKVVVTVPEAFTQKPLEYIEKLGNTAINRLDVFECEGMAFYDHSATVLENQASQTAKLAVFSKLPPDQAYNQAA